MFYLTCNRDSKELHLVCSKSTALFYKDEGLCEDANYFSEYNLDQGVISDVNSFLDILLSEVNEDGEVYELENECIALLYCALVQCKYYLFQKNKEEGTFYNVCGKCMQRLYKTL